MKKWIGLICVLLSISIHAEEKLVPIEHFFKDAQYKSVKISPDGKHIAFSFEEGTNVNLAVMNLKSKKITSMFNFNKDYGEFAKVERFMWANKERLLIWAQKRVGYLDSKGGGSGLFAANYDGSKRVNLYRSGGRAVNVISLVHKDKKHILVASKHYGDWDNEEKSAPEKIFRMNIYNGKVKYLTGLLPKNIEVTGTQADLDGNIYATFEVIDRLEELVTIYIKDKNDEWKKLDIQSVRKNPKINVVGYNVDKSKFYLLSNHDMAENDKTGLFEYDRETGKIKLLFRHSEADILRVVRGLNEEVLGVITMLGQPEIFWINPKDKAAQLYQSLAASFGGDSVIITSTTSDMQKAIVEVFGEKNAGDYYLFDLDKFAAEYLASSKVEIDPAQMAEMKPIELKARDGVQLHGYLTLPKQSQAGKNKVPLVVMVHGGPYGILDTWGYRSDIQFLANRGYGVLQVNYRGSGGYGEDFEDSGYGEWGRAMQDDVTDATLWAVEQGYTNKESICIYGGSYGGYAALQGVVREPDLYQCAIGYVGVYDLEVFFDKGFDGKKHDKDGVEYYLQKAWGKDRKLWRENSPSRNVDKIKAALFIAHGEDDVRVPMHQYEALTEALDKIGKKYIGMVKDEGHGYSQLENRIDFYGSMEKFLQKHIGYQYGL